MRGSDALPPSGESNDAEWMHQKVELQRALENHLGDSVSPTIDMHINEKAKKQESLQD